MVVMILGSGFEPVEAIAPCDILRRGGVEVQLAGIGGRMVEAGHGVTVQADCTIEEADFDRAEMVVLPGGLGGVRSILGCKAAMDAVGQAYDDGKFVAAICAGPTILAQLHITDGKTATCYPGCEAQMGSAKCVERKPRARLPERLSTNDKKGRNLCPTKTKKISISRRKGRMIFRLCPSTS